MSRYDRWTHADMPQGEELARIQRGIDETMAAIIADRYNPANSLPRSETVTVASAPKVVTAGEPRGAGHANDRLPRRLDRKQSNDL